MASTIQVRVDEDLKRRLDMLFKDLGHRRFSFKSHRYFMPYRVEENIVCVDNVYHELQDYENKMI